MEKKVHIGSLFCLLAAIVWGFGFVAQDMGAQHVGPLTFQGARTLVAAVVLALLWLGRDLYKRKKGTYSPISKEEKKYLLIGGPICGAILCAATNFQQFGISNNVSSPGKDAFITALYIVFVPLLGLFLGKRAKPHVYACVLIALFGLWLLCMSGSALTLGDMQVMICSIIFAFHIVAVDHFSPHADGIRLSCLQFIMVSCITIVLSLVFEQPAWTDISAATPAILYSGAVSAAVGYTLQIVGQKYTPPTLASLLMSLESVFAVIASAILLPHLTPFTVREVIGMVVIFAAIVLSQMEFDFKKRKET